MNIDEADSHRGGHDDGDAPARIGQELQMISTKTWPVFLLALASVSALAADARERGFIRNGMGGGEVVRQGLRSASVTVHGPSWKSISMYPMDKGWAG